MTATNICSNFVGKWYSPPKLWGDHESRNHAHEVAVNQLSLKWMLFNKRME